MSNAPLATGASRDLIEARARKAGSDFGVRLRANSEYVIIPLIALLILRSSTPLAMSELLPDEPEWP